MLSQKSDGVIALLARSILSSPRSLSKFCPPLNTDLAAIRDAAGFVRLGGHLLVAARSEKAVQAEARRGAWRPFGDGWISSEGKQTFQKGITR